MSEEKPTFKITDRRLFNNDGTPRDDAERPEPTAIETPAGAGEVIEASYMPYQSTLIETDITASEGAERPRPTASTRTSAQGSARASAATMEQEATPHPQSEIPGGAGDPTPFVNLVMFIAQPAAAALGMTEHPEMSAGDVDLPLAKHCIDLLAVLRQKTQGSLSAQEQQIMEGVVAELRMQYVSFAGVRPASAASPRGFTGGDITGGR